MPKFNIKIADRVIEITSLFCRVENDCKNYIVEGKPEFFVKIEPQDIENERKISDFVQKKMKKEQFYIDNGFEIQNFSDEYLESLAVYRKIATVLLPENIFLFHGTVAEVDGKAYMFTAKSGTGKTTHLMLWKKMLGEKLTIINGDKPLLMIKDDKVYACGTPWCGKERLNTNKTVPLVAICFLERGEVNTIEQISMDKALKKLISACYLPDEKSANANLLQMLCQMDESVDFYSLHCNMEEEAAKIAYEGMRKD